MGETILAYFLTLHNKIGKQSTILTGELTVNCMSLSLLEEDLEEKGLVAGKTEKTRGQHRTEGGKNVMSTILYQIGPPFFPIPRVPYLLVVIYAILMPPSALFWVFCSKYQDLESEKVLAESADIYAILDCIVWLQHPYVRQ